MAEPKTQINVSIPISVYNAIEKSRKEQSRSDWLNEAIQLKLTGENSDLPIKKSSKK